MRSLTWWYSRKIPIVTVEADIYREMWEVASARFKWQLKGMTRGFSEPSEPKQPSRVCFLARIPKLVFRRSSCGGEGGGSPCMNRNWEKITNRPSGALNKARMDWGRALVRSVSIHRGLEATGTRNSEIPCNP